MKELLLVLLVFLLSGAVAGCAGYDGYYSGAYAGYHSSFPVYGYPYYGYYDAFSPRFFHPPATVFHHDRRIIIDKRHSDRHFRHDYRRGFKRGHDGHLKRSPHWSFGKDRGHFERERSFRHYRDSDRNLRFYRFERGYDRTHRYGGDLRRHGPRCIGARC